MSETAPVAHSILPSWGRMALVYWRRTSHPIMSGTKRRFTRINGKCIGLSGTCRVRGSRERALRACPETSKIRVRVGGRQEWALQPGGSRSSLTTLVPAPVSTTAATETGSSPPKLKVVLTLKLSLRKTSRVPRQAHGVHTATSVRSRRPHRPRNATEADTGSPGPVKDGRAPTGAPPSPCSPIPRYPWSWSLPRDGSPSPQNSPGTCSPGCSAGSRPGGGATYLGPAVQGRRPWPACQPIGRPWRTGSTSGLACPGASWAPPDRLPRCCPPCYTASTPVPGSGVPPPR